LLRLAHRLIEPIPADHGRGEDVRGVDPVALRRRIGYVFQSGGLLVRISAVAGNIGITRNWRHAAAAISTRSTSCSTGAARSRAIPDAFPMSCPPESASASASPARSRQGRRSC